MKRLLFVAALCLLLLLSACGWIENEYFAKHQHREPSVAPSEEPIASVPTAQSAATLQTLIMSFVREGSAQNQVDVTEYDGDVGADMPEVIQRLMTNPIYAYAVDYMDYDVHISAKETLLELNMVYRRSAEEIANISNVAGMERAKEEVIKALREFDTALTLYISGYRSVDFADFICRYSLEHPNEVVEPPEVSVAVYPEQGSIRVVELHFGYADSRVDMRSMLRTVSTLLQSAGSFANRTTNTEEQLALLCEYLIGRTKYDTENSGGQSAYALLCRQKANAAGFASVTFYTLNSTDIECYLVQGTRDGAPYWWNIVGIDGAYRHMDMMRQWQEDAQTPVFYTDEEMTGYEWAREEYPVCRAPEETEESGQPESEGSSSLEPSDPDEPAEPSEYES